MLKSSRYAEGEETDDVFRTRLRKGAVTMGTEEDL